MGTTKKELTEKLLKTFQDDPMNSKRIIDFICLMCILDGFLEEHTSINLSSVLDFKCFDHIV